MKYRYHTRHVLSMSIAHGNVIAHASVPIIRAFRTPRVAAPQHTASAHNAAAAHKRWSSSVFLASNSDSVMAPASSSFLSFMIPSCMVKGGEAGGFGGGYSSSTRDSGCGPPSGPASPWEC